MDRYEKFAFDYDEFGPIDEYLGDEKDFFMRCLFVHVNGGGENIILADFPWKEVNRRLKKCFNFIPLFAFEEIRAGSNERVHEANAVF